MKKFGKEMKWDALLTGALYIVLGIVALVIPETMEKTLGYLAGVVLIIGGAVSMIGYLLRDAFQNYYHNDFFHGLIVIVAGIFVLNKAEFIIALIPFLLGVLVMISGCSKLQDVIDMKRMEYGNWIVMLIFAVINVILGVLLMANPFKSAILLFRILGVGLIFSGVTDCAVTIYFAKKYRKYLCQSTEGTYTEIVAGTEEGPTDNKQEPEDNRETVENTIENMSAETDGEV